MCDNITINEVRPEVQAFAVEMEKILRENDHKGGWRNCGYTFLKYRAVKHMVNVVERVESGHINENMLKECYHSANYLMMMCDTLTNDMKTFGQEASNETTTE